MMLEIRKLIKEAWITEGASCGFENLWNKWLYRNYPQLKEKHIEFPSDVLMRELYKGKEYKTSLWFF